ncbi:Piwi-like protein 1 [Acropora cervicornis]|uniref:Piwi-like protein 1 n=1 Tax=Acropora cervicornis TaxID=6130 RepID=A0AAD9QJY5_ACRCE|nr:Piwi-like protein 1 [Acropora cervicornis]
MTGRARGRSRGRGRGGGGGDAARRPGEGPQEAQREQAAPVGRGRSRGPPPAQVPAPAPQRPPPAQAEPPTQAMAKMAVSQEQRPPRRSRDIVDDVATKPQHIVDKKGSTGGKIALLTNHFKLRTKPEFGVYQYNVSFNPEQESKRVRVALLRNQRAVIGEVHAFDGMMLYLPIRLPETNTVINLTKQNGDPVQMTITYTNDVLRDSPSMMQLFNIIFRRLELWPGYTTSIMPYETDVLLSADVSHKVLRQTTVLEFLYELYNSGRARNFYDEACKQLIGQIVLTRYRRLYSHFLSLSIVYDKQIIDMDQPLLVSRLKKIPGQKMRIQDGEILLVPELCFLTGLTDDMRNDFSLMKDLAVHTRFEPETLTLPGRVLPPEKIYQSGGRSYSYDPKTADWSREMRGMPLYSTVNLNNWLLIYSSRDSNNAKDFEQTLKKVGGPMGITVAPGIDCRIQDDRTETYLNAIKSNYSHELQMVVTILTTNRKDRYDAIKKLCCLEKPVPSQVIVGRTISKKQMLMSVSTKIAIQLNCKLGGEAWALEIPTMVVGIDTYHDSSAKGRSVGGFVASVNQTLTKYYSRVSFQHTGMEFIDALKTNMTAALRRYQEVNRDLPERIMIYRDGVGDGQLRTVVEHEVPQLKASFSEVSGGYKPKFSVIIVKKRISARLFNKGDGVNLTNPPPGTVVDTDITRKDWFDFFLGTVRVPAPCQYAHKLAFLVGQSLHKPPSHELADKLFFL